MVISYGVWQRRFGRHRCAASPKDVLSNLVQRPQNREAYDAVMANIALEDFIGTYRDALIRRCQAKVDSRVSPPYKAASRHGVPLFLDQLCGQLRDGSSESDEIGDSAKKHGYDLLKQGFTIEQVVHDYGDVCQSITDLAVEVAAPISTDDFRTLNRCLDNAIAGAVTEFTREQGLTRDTRSAEVNALLEGAIFAFRIIHDGDVGVGGSTGALVERNLMAIYHALNARPPEPEQEKPLTSTSAM